MSILLKHIKKNDGFTLIELVIVVLLVSIFSMLAVPRISSFFSSKRDYFNLITSIIAKTFDDSFLHDRTNYIAIHLYGTEVEEMKSTTKSTSQDEIFARKNGISVLNYKNGSFVDNERQLFRYRAFPESFKIETVLLPSGEEYSEGNFLIPFYQQGYSDNIIIRILVDNEFKFSIRIYKHMKEPEVIEGYASFDGMD